MFVSRPGRPEDLYPATVQPDGSAHVFTGNLFGSGNLVITLDEKVPAFRVQIANPFRELAPGYPNQRETVLWWPMVDVKAGQELILPVLKTSEGLILVVEGLTADGTPVYFRSGH